jgi:hypothetical protein
MVDRNNVLKLKSEYQHALNGMSDRTAYDRHHRREMQAQINMIDIILLMGE